MRAVTELGYTAPILLSWGVMRPKRTYQWKRAIMVPPVVEAVPFGGLLAHCFYMCTNLDYLGLFAFGMVKVSVFPHRSPFFYVARCIPATVVIRNWPSDLILLDIKYGCADGWWWSSSIVMADQNHDGEPPSWCHDPPDRHTLITNSVVNLKTLQGLICKLKEYNYCVCMLF